MEFSNNSNDMTSINISSKQVSEHIDGMIINLTKIISIEEKIGIPEAIQLVRKLLLAKQFQLLTPEDKQQIIKLRKITEDNIKNNIYSDSRLVYNVLKIFDC